MYDMVAYQLTLLAAKFDCELPNCELSNFNTSLRKVQLQNIKRHRNLFAFVHCAFLHYGVKTVIENEAVCTERRYRGPVTYRVHVFTQA